MRILLLSFSYLPVSNARALRWSALAADWVRRGHDVVVVTNWLPSAPDYERIEGVAVNRAGFKWAERLRARSAARRTKAVPNTSAFQGVSLPRRLWRAVYWPDTSCAWFLPALLRARELSIRKPPDAVISVSPTYTAVTAGLALLRSTQLSSTPWLVDLGDPFSFAEEAQPNNFRLYRGLNKRVEAAAFARATAVSVTTEETRARYASLFAGNAAKIQVIPPLLSIDVDRPASGCDDRISLVYVGTLYRAIRGPDFLLALLRLLLERCVGRRLELHIYGDVQDCRPALEGYSEFLGRNLFVHGIVPRQAAIEAMQSASVLVNIGNRTTYQLPSKLVEYAALGKPILNIATVADDSSARFLSSYPRQLSLLGSGAPTEEQIRRCERFLEDAVHGRLSPVAEDWVEPYRLPHISERYLALLKA